MKALEALAALVIRQAAAADKGDDLLLTVADGVISALGSFTRGHQSAASTMEQLNALKDHERLLAALEQTRAATLADLGKKFGDL